uniref:Inhibitor of growth protein 4 n=1 Tax=Tetraselmis sp. GSL018 TaxID=582737 RepID=A0A061R8K6_9CHLO|mmetsp:Transcript_31147/g.74043  ORF Transcript_31147/g.74043 Transcript_31147/m.74043 type:complete len:236 (-) Transcript_31147:369-1076(-)
MTTNIAATSYVQKFVNEVADLPVSLKRNFALMRELDTKAQNLKEEIQAAANKKLQNQTVDADPEDEQPEASGPSFDETIEAQIRQLLQYEEEKVSLATHVYTTVDNHIKVLDSDLVALKGEIDGERASSVEPSKRGRPKGGRKRREPDAEGAREDGRNQADRAAPAADVMGQVFDSNEPVYCYCRQVSFGDMIGCDNEDCPIEWFHYGCVGITPETVPDVWYCKDCQKLKDEGKI